MSGYIQASRSLPNDDALASVLQQMIVGITGLPGTLVRPRWQPQPPTQPSVTTVWCAIGITSYTPYDYPQWTQDDTSGILHRYERLDALATFYGPQSASYAAALRDGLYVAQNHETLSAQGIKLRSVDETTHLGELINSQYVSRSDVPLSFVRFVERTYDAIPAIAQISVSFLTDTGLHCIITANN
jgi:hypothetical protein